VNASHHSASLLRHGASQLSLVDVDTYNEELRDDEGFVGDRASRRAFRAILEEWRERIRELGEDDPLGAEASQTIPKKTLDTALKEGEPLAAGLVDAAIEEFSGELASVIRRFLRLKRWRDTERIVIGGGIRSTRVGEVAIARATDLVKSSGIDVDIVPIRHDAEQAGLIGCVHLAPAWALRDSDAILAVDIGGTNIRAGIVASELEQAPDLTGCRVVTSELWRHTTEGPAPTRDEMIAQIVAVLEGLIHKAQEKRLKLAPLIGVACPGVIGADGSIERGAQNLPGNWESSRFNLPESLRNGIPCVGEYETQVVMHNDAVVQGLSVAPFMRDVQRWGILTIGTGLGNARFTNRATPGTEGMSKAKD
jgi:hypothetical protein